MTTANGYPTIHDRGDHLDIEWPPGPRPHTIPITPELIESWVTQINDLRAALRDQAATADGALPLPD